MSCWMGAMPLSKPVIDHPEGDAPAGAGHRLSGKTLVFVIDLIDVK